ncbi:unnamed protein product, partial [Ectocarpus sp. 12 AP-2014]
FATKRREGGSKSHGSVRRQREKCAAVTELPNSNRRKREVIVVRKDSNQYRWRTQLCQDEKVIFSVCQAAEAENPGPLVFSFDPDQ